MTMGLSVNAVRRQASEIAVPLDHGARARAYVRLFTEGPDHAPVAPCTHRDTWRVVFGMDAGRLDSDPVGPAFTRSADACALARLLNGEEPATEAPGHVASRYTSTAVAADTGEGAIDAPRTGNPGPARRCVVCDSPLPADARSDATTCGGACRVRLHRQRAEA